MKVGVSTQTMNRINQIILGGLLYGKLAILFHALFVREPGMKFIFNVGLSLAAIVTGLTLKAFELRRFNSRFNQERPFDGQPIHLSVEEMRRHVREIRRKG